MFIVLYIFCFAEKCFNCEGRGHIRADCYSGPSERAKGAQRGKWRGRGGRRARGGGGGFNIWTKTFLSLDQLLTQWKNKNKKKLRALRCFNLVLFAYACITLYSIDVMSKIIVINKGEIIAKCKGVVSDILIHKVVLLVELGKLQDN